VITRGICTSNPAARRWFPAPRPLGYTMTRVLDTAPLIRAPRPSSEHHLRVIDSRALEPSWRTESISSRFPRASDPRCVKSAMVQMACGDWVALRLACGTCRRASSIPFISTLLSLCLVDFIRRLALALTHTSRLQLLVSFTIPFIHLPLNLCVPSVRSSSAGTVDRRCIKESDSN
jgi:hypothetical protein